MDLKKYFDTASGTGILATASQTGEVNGAIYSKPRIQDDGTAAFIMRERLTHKYIQDNHRAAYIFIEDGPDYRGIRLYLTRIREDQDPELMAAMTRRHLTPEEDKARGPKFIVYFRVEKILQLIGSGEIEHELG